MLKQQPKCNNVGPGGVGLPDRDYYVSEDADSKEKRAKCTSRC
jgi:predicted metalloendopeptidase